MGGGLFAVLFGKLLEGFLGGADCVVAGQQVEVLLGGGSSSTSSSGTNEGLP